VLVDLVQRGAGEVVGVGEQPIGGVALVAGEFAGCGLGAVEQVRDAAAKLDVVRRLPQVPGGSRVAVGGEPGAGKSSILQLLVAVGALDPSVRLTLLDPKLVELAVWQGCAARLVGPNVDEAIEVLRGCWSSWTTAT
jgi:hypothetical protein